MEMNKVDCPELDKALGELFAALHEYREYIKRNHPEKLTGVMFAKDGTELLIYSQNENYNQQLLRLTWDAKGDSWSLTERSEP